MIKFNSLALATALFAASSAATCGPTYSSGTYNAGDIVSMVSINYQCKTGDVSQFCGQQGFEPGNNVTNYWTLAWTDLGACSGTYTPPAPTSKPTYAAWDKSGCPESFSNSVQYKKDDIVEHMEVVFKCKTDNGRCQQAGYEPLDGTYWQEAWDLLGSCSGVITPTISPSHAGTAMGKCPDEYDSTALYEKGDKIAFNSFIYECVNDMGRCRQAGFEPGTEAGDAEAWSRLGWCDGSGVPTSSPSHSGIADGKCPPEHDPTVLYETGDKVSFNEFIYECKTDNGRCRQVGYEPGSANEAEAWVRKGWCLPSIAPTVSPSHAGDAAGKCPDEHDPTVAYTTGDKVSYNEFMYVCKTSNGRCSQVGYEPGSDNESEAWDRVGWCLASIAPTLSPSHAGVASGPCPNEYDSTAKYTTGDKVSFNEFVFVCKTSNGRCAQSGYAPGDSLYAEAWTKLGWCDGSYSPTSSPTAYSAPPASCPPEWVEGSSYEENDLVRNGNKVYKCRGYPNYLWCGGNTDYYKPGFGSIWKDAWSAAGTC